MIELRSTLYLVKRHCLVLVTLLSVAFPGYGLAAETNSPEDNKGWLSEDWDKARGQIQNHFRGSDAAMMEVGYRFRELYFAGKDRNWEYADYQLEKIGKVVELAAERRPKRAQSAGVFLKKDLPDVAGLVKERTPASFDAAMNRLKTSCMKCHVAENVPFFAVRFPKSNPSVIAIHDGEIEGESV